MRYVFDLYTRVQTKKCHEFTLRNASLRCAIFSLSLVLEPNCAVTHIRQQRYFVESYTIHTMIGVNEVVMPRQNGIPEEIEKEERNINNDFIINLTQTCNKVDSTSSYTFQALCCGRFALF